MSFDLRSWSDPLRSQVDDCLLARFRVGWPPALAEACAYPIQAGGKRVRPLWVLAACEAVGGDPKTAGAIAVAASVELVHTYSLVHDDLPCMDDDDERRGLPTVHVRYGVAPALLVGDALLTEAFAALGEAALPPERAIRLVAELGRAAGHAGMVGGQAADIGMAGPVQDLDTLQRVHQGKTGTLIRASVRMGAILGGASVDVLDRLTRYGEAMGLAFQMADDVLDADEAASPEGPPSYVRLLGVDETRRRARALLNLALEAIRGLPSPEPLAALARYTVERDH